jgi:hypothetical protein
MLNLNEMTLSGIASVIRNDWKKVYFGAEPYLDAMSSLQSIDDDYHCDSGKMIVAYFLGNASTWKGEKAKLIKAHLKSLLKK